MQFLDLSLRKVPIWIKILHLPVEYWNHICLRHVASGVGRPLYAGTVTEANHRLGFTQVFMEVDLEAEFLREIEVDMGDGNSFLVGIEYPWIPMKCPKCNLFFWTLLPIVVILKWLIQRG
ncbi:hypothetical protein CMV_012143 [Castanea mollissima]|uniref:DUF4283 domain-containing protein n=1 Tax=Castanea mollissima TaxID=60419 RepID=A0A8J4R412_9ROSI|nr:hypothetical protein CMV_012143 [Castanea mollissima]